MISLESLGLSIHEKRMRNKIIQRKHIEDLRMGARDTPLRL